jgi:ABC-type nitrate/sulfonate/bicarbonate transport system substrate-binding protein
MEESHMKRYFPFAPRAGALALGLVFVLAACSSNTGSSSSATQSASVAPASGSAAEATPTGTPAPASLKVGVSDAIFAFSPLYVAKEKGFWKDLNLDVELSFFNSGTETQQALLGDAIDIGAGGYTEPVTLTAQGAPTVIFGATQSGLPYQLMTQPSITDIKQLPGKILGVSKVGSLSDQITRIILNKVGIDPSEVKIQQAGGSSARLAALQAKAIDGSILSSPANALAVKDGFNKLIDASTLLPGFAYEVVYAKKSFIESNQDVMDRFMKGLIQGAQFVTDPANKDEAIQITNKTTNEKVEDLELSYDDTIKDFPKTSAAQLDGIAQALDGTIKFGGVSGAEKLKPEDLFYGDLQKQAAKELGLE